jgi:hypothetical protein
MNTGGKLSETFVDFWRAIWRYIPEDKILLQRCYSVISVWK